MLGGILMGIYVVTIAVSTIKANRDQVFSAVLRDGKIDHDGTLYDHQGTCIGTVIDAACVEGEIVPKGRR